MVPGDAFCVTEGSKSAFVRASFSTASPEMMEEAIKRFAQLLKSEL
jgi:DNA-binding transcriptional MocR family regulator